MLCCFLQCCELCAYVQLVGLPVEDATKLLLVAEVYNHKVRAALGRQILLTSRKSMSSQ